MFGKTSCTSIVTASTVTTLQSVAKHFADMYRITDRRLLMPLATNGRSPESQGWSAESNVGPNARRVDSASTMVWPVSLSDSRISSGRLLARANCRGSSIRDCKTGNFVKISAP